MKVLRKVRDALKRFEVPLFIVAVVLGVYLAAANLLRGAKYPSEAIWAPWHVLFAGMLAAAVFVPVYAFYKALDAYLLGADEAESELRKDLELVCQRTVAALADSCDAVSVNDVSAQVWLCKADGTFDPRACFMLPEGRPGDGTEWRKGKGIAGTAWEAGRVVIADLGQLKEQLRGLGDRAFDQLDPSERYGMTAAEVTRTLAYTGVCAIPLFSKESSPQLLGIFLVDYTASEGFGCIGEKVLKRPIANYLGASEEILTEAKAILPV